MGLLWALLDAFMSSRDENPPKYSSFSRSSPAQAPPRYTTDESDYDWEGISHGGGSADYFQDCADEWGMSREDAIDQIMGE